MNSNKPPSPNSTTLTLRIGRDIVGHYALVVNLTLRNMKFLAYSAPQKKAAFTAPYVTSGYVKPLYSPLCNTVCDKYE